MFWFQRQHEGLHSIFAGSYVEECDLPSKGCGESNSEDWSRTPIQRAKVSVCQKALINIYSKFDYKFVQRCLFWSDVIIILFRAVGGVRKRQSGSSNTAADCNFSKGIKVFVLFSFLKGIKMQQNVVFYTIVCHHNNRSKPLRLRCASGTTLATQLIFIGRLL